MPRKIRHPSDDQSFMQISKEKKEELEEQFAPPEESSKEDPAAQSKRGFVHASFDKSRCLPWNAYQGLSIH